MHNYELEGMINRGTPTAREMEIIRQLSQGKSSKEIAVVLQISSHTVDTHRRNILKKMRMARMTEVIMHAVKQGWL